MFDRSKKLNLPELEEKVLAVWKVGNIFEKTLTAREGGLDFVFYEGPPTANGKPGLHHVVGRIFKDVILRYKTMRGYRVVRRAGWDTHGLPVEIAVEKELGIKNKSEIEKYGIAAFNAKAKESVWKYKEDWERMTERIGFWLDMAHPYITYDADYISRVWGVLKKIDERGLLYKGHKVVPWCSRCGTALASHELAQGYKKTKDLSVFVKFKILSGAFEGSSFLVWTTTPWTLPGNVALAVNPAHSFVMTKTDGETIIVEKNAAARLGLVAVREISAQELIALEYEPLFDVAPLQSEKSYIVYPADFVTAGEGTGIVHTAVMYGEDDYALGVSLGLPQVHTVDEAGNFTDAVTGFAGMRAKNKTTEEKIISHLTERGRVWKTEHYEHDYPYCWRCDTPIIYYATDSWFIAMSRLRAELVTANDSVNWIPAHIKDGRFGEWLREAKDWAISRARYWGTPLPIWECIVCGTYRVVGSLAELGDIAPKNEVGEIDLHRPFIDAVYLPCEKCGGETTRVKEVMDVWFDSGAMPFATEEFPARYPADFVCEAIDQTRGWFYTLLAVGVATGAGAPYKNVMCYSHLLDKAGKKMSKSRGNTVDPEELITTHGIDALRWHFFTSAIIRESQIFDPATAGKEGRAFLSLIYNSYVFLATYSLSPRHAESDEASPDKNANGNILDEWIMVRMHETITTATKYLDDYEISDATRVIEELVNDVSRWYLRRSRKRSEALPVLRAVLLEMSKLLAPFTPFFAEALYRSVGGLKESVHLEDWLLDSSRHAESNEASIRIHDAVLVASMSWVRNVASMALAARAKAGINVRQPLARLAVRTSDVKNIAERIAQNSDFIDVLTEEINVKEIIFDNTIPENEVRLDIVITPVLKKEGIYRELARMAQGLRQAAGCVPSDMVSFVVFASEDTKVILQEMQAQFMKDTNAKDIAFGEVADCDAEVTEEIGGVTARMGIKK